MLVFLHLEAAPDHLHGYVHRFLHGITATEYVGTASRRVADELWQTIQQRMPTDAGRAFMVTPASDETGYDLRLHQMDPVTTRDFDGISLPAIGARSLKRKTVD